MSIDCESVYLSSSAVKQTSETLRKNIIRYLCGLLTSFIVVIVVSKRVTLSWRKTDFSQPIWPAGDQLTTAFAILNCLEYKFLKGFFGPRATAVILKILHPFQSFQIPWNYSDVFQINEKFIHNCSPCLFAEMAKVASSGARPRKCYINRLQRFIFNNYSPKARWIL